MSPANIRPSDGKLPIGNLVENMVYQLYFVDGDKLACLNPQKFKGQENGDYVFRSAHQDKVSQRIDVTKAENFYAKIYSKQPEIREEGFRHITGLKQKQEY